MPPVTSSMPHGDLALTLIELGLVVIGLAALGRVAHRFGFSTIPLYLVAGLAFGQGGLAPLALTHDFVHLGSEIGVLLLLFTLGLEYTGDQLLGKLRTSLPAGLADLVLNALPGLVAAALLGWDLRAALVLGAVTWISSSGIAARILTESGRLATPGGGLVLALLVIEDLAMAVVLPLLTWALDSGTGDVGALVFTLAAVTVALVLAFRSNTAMPRVIEHVSDEVVLFTALGLMLIVAGLAEKLHVSSAVGAFVVGISISGQVAHRARHLLGPLRDLFAALFFLFFGLQIDPTTLPPVLPAAAALCAVTIGTKLLTGAVAARSAGLTRAEGWCAGTSLVARGEFSIVLANLGMSAGLRPELGTLAAAYVLLTAILGPLLARRR